MQNQQLESINIHKLVERCRTKKEIYRFLSYDCKAYLPKIESVNVYFFKQIISAKKDVNLNNEASNNYFQQYLKRDEVKVASAPHIEGLTVQDFLNFARSNPAMLKFLPDERDWVHLERQWICDVLYSIDSGTFQDMIDHAIQTRQEKYEHSQNLTIKMRPEFVQALEQCVQFSNDKGRSVFLIKESSKRKRTRSEIEEVKGEEEKLKQDKQLYFRESKRLKRENETLQNEIHQLQNSQEMLNTLMEAGIINQEGQLQSQHMFEI